MAYTGDVPANSIIPSNGSIVRNGADSAFIFKPLDSKTYSLTIASPTSGLNIVMGVVCEDTTMQYLEGIVDGGTSVYVSAKYQTTPYVSGTSIGSVTLNTSGYVSTGVSASVSNGNWLQITVGAVSGSVTAVTVLLRGIITI